MKYDEKIKRDNKVIDIGPLSKFESLVSLKSVSINLRYHK